MVDISLFMFLFEVNFMLMVLIKVLLLHSTFFFSSLKFKLLENVRFTLSRYSFDDSTRNIETVVLKPR